MPRRTRRRRLPSRVKPSVAIAALVSLAVPSWSAGSGVPGVVDLTVQARHDTEPVVLTGKDLGLWSAPADVTARLPLHDAVDCPPAVDPTALGDPTKGGAGALGDAVKQQCPAGYDQHNHYAPPDASTGAALGQGTPADQLLGYRWDANRWRFVQVPLQVDEVFTRYLNNQASGFAVYSGEDQHTTYAFDREGFRYTRDGPADDPCRARPDSPPAKDPVPGLDDNDEVAFMAADAGPLAPSTAGLPAGIEGAKAVRIADPQKPGAPPSFVYVMKAKPGGPKPAFDASNGYVHYQRDKGADLFAFSQSSYDNYGNAATGVYCGASGAVVIDPHTGRPAIGRRRPRDGATVTTGRYRFRYDGRWLMTGLRISPDGGQTYGPDLVDRWKARAFAQDPSSNTPCCGYEEEDTNWGGSSTLLGERVGPVRAVRETWGADSGTNVIRRETFYRDEMRQKTWLRVHVIPPADGIYAQWDFNAGRMTRFFNARNPPGVAIDGRNDEAFGNLDDPCNPAYDGNERGALDQGHRDLMRAMRTCDASGYHLSMDLADPAFSGTSAPLEWGVTSGPYGTVVDRISASVTDLTPGGAAQSVFAVPYYRDDACFDDGTGSDPGPELHPRKPDDEAVSTASDGSPRRCWDPRRDAAAPGGDDRFRQGDIGSHGLHLLLVAESDNARQTVPLDEIVSDWRMVMLPGQRDATAGEQYGRGFEKPLLAAVIPAVVGQGGGVAHRRRQTR